MQEQTWLAKCWCDSSENSVEGNSQRKDAFWRKVKGKFMNNELGWERNTDQLSSKWRDVNKVCMEMMPIFDDIKKNWRSGANDDDIYESALESYKNQYAKEFRLKDTFLFLKDHPKWNVPDDPVGRAQESELFGDNADVVNLSQDFEQELFGNMPIPRPVGRERAKKSAKSDASSDAATSSRGKSSGSSRVDDFLDNMTRYKGDLTTKRGKAIDKFTEYVTLQTAATGLDVLQRSTENMEPGDAIRLRKLKRMVRRKMKTDLNIDDKEEEEEEDEDEDEGDD